MGRRSRLDPLEQVRIHRPDEEVRAPSERAEPEISYREVRREEPPEIQIVDPVIPPPAPPVLSPIYEVLEGARISLRGQILLLKAGRRISEETHGPGIIEYLRRAKVKIRQI